MTPFMKLTDKKKKIVKFDARDALERTSENMEQLTALMDKMYIKLEQKEVPYNPQIYQRRGRGQNRQNFRQSNNWRGNRSFSRDHNNINRGYGRDRGNFWRGKFEVGLIIILVEIIVEVEKIEGHGGNLDQEKEEGDPGHHLVLD